MERLVQVAAPAAEPVTLERAKLHCRCQHTLEDDLFRAWISAARDHAESETGRQLLTATWRLTLEGFPEDDRIDLHPSPVQAITAVRYYDGEGALQTLDAQEYQLAGDEVGAWLQPAPGAAWPSTESGRLDAVQVEFHAGYGDAATAVPEVFKQAILLMVGQWYLHREELADVARPEVPTAAQRLLQQRTTWRYA